jgi:predicted  nucleic acid-binding Zn-ribbon protein
LALPGSNRAPWALSLQTPLRSPEDSPRDLRTILDLKREVDTIKKTQSETTLEIETLGKKSGTIDANISNRIQEMEERISGVEDSIENIDTTIKENGK